MTLALLFVLFYRQSDTLHHYVTVCWGISAICVLLAGFVFRARPSRMVGLVGLMLCIPRVFVVDIRSSLYRISAFAVLATVLLAVGFLYRRYRGLIEAWDAIDDTDEDRANDVAPCCG